MTLADRIAASLDGSAGPDDTRDARDIARSDLVALILDALAAGWAGAESRTPGGDEGRAELLGALIATPVQDAIFALEARAWALALAPVPAKSMGRPEAIAWDRIPVKLPAGSALAAPGLARWATRLGGAVLAAEKPMAELPVFPLPADPNHGSEVLRVTAGASCRAFEDLHHLGSVALIAEGPERGP